MEVDRPEDDDTHGDGCNEETRSGGKELPEDEHDARRAFRGLAEAVADVSVNGDGLRVVEFGQEECRDDDSADDSPYAAHDEGQVGIEAQFGRPDKRPGADRGSRGGENHQPRRHRTPGEKNSP